MCEGPRSRATTKEVADEYHLCRLNTCCSLLPGRWKLYI